MVEKYSNGTNMFKYSALNDSRIISKLIMCQNMNLICDQIHCHEDMFGKETIHQMHFLVFVRANFFRMGAVFQYKKYVR